MKKWLGRLVFFSVCYVASVATVVFGLSDHIIDNAVSLKMLASRVNTLEETVSLKHVQKLTVTAYSPRRVETDDDPFINASMTPVSEGQIAVSRDLFNDGWVFYRYVYIKGYGIFEIRDLMNVRYKKRIDVFFNDTRKARQWGVKRLTVALLANTENRLLRGTKGLASPPIIQ